MVTQMGTRIQVRACRLSLDWRPNETGGYWTRYNGATWYLEATPKARWPWLLHDGGDNRQEIGNVDPEAARRASETWLDISSRAHYPHTAPIFAGRRARRRAVAQ